MFTASAAFSAALQILGLVILRDESYIPARWQGLLLYWAVLLYGAALNIWGARLLPTANLAAGTIKSVRRTTDKYANVWLR